MSQAGVGEIIDTWVGWHVAGVQYKALAALSTGLAGFYGLYQLAVYNDKASTCPFVRHPPHSLSIVGAEMGYWTEQTE